LVDIKSSYLEYVCIFVSLNYGPINHGLALLPDIGKTITSNILPSSLSAYAVRIERYNHYVDRQ